MAWWIAVQSEPDETRCSETPETTSSVSMMSDLETKLVAVAVSIDAVLIRVTGYPDANVERTIRSSCQRSRSVPAACSTAKSDAVKEGASRGREIDKEGMRLLHGRDRALAHALRALLHRSPGSKTACDVIEPLPFGGVNRATGEELLDDGELEGIAS
jgi:hypothetical protein